MLFITVLYGSPFVCRLSNSYGSEVLRFQFDYHIKYEQKYVVKGFKEEISFDFKNIKAKGSFQVDISWDPIVDLQLIVKNNHKSDKIPLGLIMDVEPFKYYVKPFNSITVDNIEVLCSYDYVNVENYEKHVKDLTRHFSRELTKIKARQLIYINNKSHWFKKDMREDILELNTAIKCEDKYKVTFTYLLNSFYFIDNQIYEFKLVEINLEEQDVDGGVLMTKKYKLQIQGNGYGTTIQLDALKSHFTGKRFQFKKMQCHFAIAYHESMVNKPSSDFLLKLYTEKANILQKSLKSFQQHVANELRHRYRVIVPSKRRVPRIV